MNQELAVVRDKKNPQKMRAVYPYFEILYANCKFCGYEKNGFCWKKPQIKRRIDGQKQFVNTCKRTVSEIKNLHKKNGSAEVQPSTR